ncbi:HesA/MoeB/ThiF family protein [Hyphobacterium indicum]|uniref:HesA/MoeB/ThiF family protein n=1 Tax=Hyphobacterium indicum TaxID=2162714 RepID=UPI000D658683|nr:molybdopterin-synthase adenylyltransferase MoeB [Hyphobacterium indicum]
MEDEEIERYARHLVLKEIGGPGQQRLRAASALIVGAGGLGGPAALYLAAAGVGTITLIDPDTVSLDNLQRQVQFATGDVGQPKAAIAAQGLARLNPLVNVRAVQAELTPENAVAVLAGSDVVLDGCDNFETRFAVNAACHHLGKPLISGAVGRWTGQVAVFTSGLSKGTPCYQCFVPAIPPDAETCERVGVVGALTGIIGSMMALEAIKWITGAGNPLSGRLLMYDGLAGTSRTLTLHRDSACPVCGQ